MLTDETERLVRLCCTVGQETETQNISLRFQTEMYVYLPTKRVAIDVSPRPASPYWLRAFLRAMSDCRVSRTMERASIWNMCIRKQPSRSKP